MTNVLFALKKSTIIKSLNIKDINWLDINDLKAATKLSGKEP